MHLPGPFTSSGVDLLGVPRLRFCLMLQGLQINTRVCTRTDVANGDGETMNS